METNKEKIKKTRYGITLCLTEDEMLLFKEYAKTQGRSLTNLIIYLLTKETNKEKK